MSAIIEQKYYSDDSISRYEGKLLHYREDIARFFYQDKNDEEIVDDYKSVQNKRKLWEFVLKSKQMNETQKNIFYLYFYEMKKQKEIAYLCEVSQAYVAKSIKQLVAKIKKIYVPYEQLELFCRHNSIE